MVKENERFINNKPKVTNFNTLIGNKRKQSRLESGNDDTSLHSEETKNILEKYIDNENKLDNYDDNEEIYELNLEILDQNCCGL